MRVLVVTVVHDPEDARIRHRQLPALLRAGWDVTYAAPFSTYDREPPRGVRPVDLPRAAGRRRVAALLAALRLLRRERGRHDVVLVHDPELLVAAAASGARGVVWDVHEDTAAALSLKPWLPSWARRPVAAGVRLLERLAERRVGLLLAEEGYRGRFSRPHPVVPNSVLVPEEDPPPPGTGRAVYLGRLNRKRGALDLVELGRLLRGRVAVELVGPCDADVRAAVQAAHDAGEVVWHGFVPNDRALALLPGALAGLSLLHDEPNYAHSRPTKLMEYMAHGLPVVTTPNEVSAELVRRYGCGVVVPFGDVGAVRAALEDLVADDATRVRTGADARRAAVEDLSWWNDAPAFVRALSEASRRGR